MRRLLLSTEFTVGTFALLGLMVIIYMSLEVNDRTGMAGANKVYHAYFESVSGLVRKVPVEISGIAAGYVDAIDLVDNRARVTVRLRDEIKVYADAVLSVRDRGILGDKYLMLNPGSTNQPELASGDEIKKTFSRSDFEKVTAALAETSETIKELVQSDDPKGALGKVVVNLRDLTGRLNEMVGENQDRINQILKNIDSFSKNMDDITSDNKEQIHNVLLALEDVAESMKMALGRDGNINKATASLQRILDKVEKGEGTIGKLINDDTTVNNLNSSLEGLNDTLGLFRKVQLGVRYRGEYLFSSEKMQNLVALTLAPAPDKYLMLEVVAGPVGQTKVLNTTVNTGGNTVSTTQTIQTDDNMLFTFLMAKRFWDFTLRFGLIRNEGGAGFDYHLFKDRFTVSFESFDFSRVNDRPHLRAYGTLVLYKHLLLTGGADDLITKTGRRNGFAGAGIQFTDNDLKALVTTLPFGRL